MTGVFAEAVKAMANQPLHVAFAIGFVISVFCNVISLMIIAKFARELGGLTKLLETLVYRRRRQDD